MPNTVKPNFIDRAIAYVSPRHGMERQAWREAQASYKGGVSTRLSEGYQRDTPYTFQSNAERTILLGSRDRAYQAYENNPVAETLVNVETNNVIGDGLNYQPTTNDEAWNREAKDKYYEWLDTCSVRGSDFHSGCDIQRHLWSQSRVAGDIGWILVAQGPDSRIQIVPGENIVTPDDGWGDPTMYHGVKLNAQGAPVSFSVLGVDAYTGVRKFQTIQARDFVYFPHLKRANQVRGVTCYNTIFDLLANLDRYVEGVSLAAWMATVFGLIFKEQTAAKQLSALPLITNSQGNQQRAITIEKGGQVKYTAPEGEVVQVDAKQPMQNTPDFIKAMYRMLGQPFDMPLEMIAMDMSSCNFASARIGLLPFQASCRIKAGRFVSRWSRTVRWWLSRERLRAPNDPKRWTTPFPERFWGHDFLVNAWSYTDPVSEAQADLLQIEMGTKSVPMVISERGRDAEQILRDRKEWGAKVKDLPPPEVRSSLTREPPAGSSDENDKAFKRDVVKTLLTDATVKNVFYNVTDIPGLLAAAGLPSDPDVDSANGEGVPFLPVVGIAGPMVSGDTIQGSDGVLVGGDVELPEPAAMPDTGDPAQPDPNQQDKKP